MKTIKIWNDRKKRYDRYFKEEYVLKLIKDWFDKRLINVNWEALKQKFKKNDN